MLNKILLSFTVILFSLNVSSEEVHEYFLNECPVVKNQAVSYWFSTKDKSSVRHFRVDFSKKLFRFSLSSKKRFLNWRDIDRFQLSYSSNDVDMILLYVDRPFFLGESIEEINFGKTSFECAEKFISTVGELLTIVKIQKKSG